MCISRSLIKGVSTRLIFAYHIYSYDTGKNELLVTTFLQLDNYHIPFLKYKKTKLFFDAVLAENNGKIVIKK
ncbi:MAG: hypothetical protein ABIO04_01745 [Ferruginibacter sp.]